MPLAPPALQGLMQPLFAGVGLVGISSPQLVLGLSNGITQYLLTLTVQTNDVGTLGVGVGTGTCVVTPPSLIGPLTAMAAASGLIGTFTPGMMTAIGNAVATFISTNGVVTTASPLVAVGAGVGILILAGPAPLLGLLQSNLAAVGLVGTGTAQLATAISNGIVQGLTTGIVNVAIVGTPIAPPPLPSTGVGIGKLL